MNGRELEVVFSGISCLPLGYRKALSKVISWEAMCFLLNGLSIDFAELVTLEEQDVKGEA